jgi:hypothetical protein
MVLFALLLSPPSPALSTHAKAQASSLIEESIFVVM